jgi:glycosyltransferase involved in cell wall biosynthesis
MTRFGMNPARNKTISYAPSRVTAAMVSYIPNLEGYFQHRLEVLRLSLESLIQSLDQTCDIMIFNNGSCQEVVDYLETQLRSGRINYLIHSQINLGVIGAFKVLFNAAPGEIIAYSDDDVLYYPGWLDAHLKILTTLPRVGMVSGAPVGFSSEHALTAVSEFIHDPAESVEVSKIPRNENWESSWAESTGRPVDEHLLTCKNTPNLQLTYQGVDAIQGAKHFQFVTPKEVITRALDDDWSGSLMDGLVSLDESVDKLGYLRLSTPSRYARHIGNALTEETVEEAKSLSIPYSGQAQVVQEHVHWLLRIPGSGRILWPLYRWLFKVLHKVR